MAEDRCQNSRAEKRPKAAKLTASNISDQRGRGPLAMALDSTHGRVSSRDGSRRQARRFPARRAQLDELALRSRVLVGEGLADLDAEGPDVLGAEATVVHDACVFAAGEAGASALG